MRIWATSLQLIKKFLVRKELEKIRGVKISIHLFFFKHAHGGVRNSDYRSIVSNTNTFEMILQRRAHPLKKRPASSKKAGRKRWWASSLPVMRPWRPFPIWTDGKEFKLIGSLSSRYAFTHFALELDFFKTGPFR